MQRLLHGLGAGLLMALAACVGPDGDGLDDANVAVAEARLPEIRYYMIADT